MKLMDEEGRIFGKLNVIDFAIILFFIFLLPMAYYSHKIFYKKTPLVKPVYKNTVTLKSIVYGLDEDAVKKINKGDKEYDRFGTEIGEVVDVKKLRIGDREIDAGEGKKIKIKDTSLVLFLKLKGNIKGNRFIYQGKTLLYKNPLVFKTRKYLLEVYPEVKPRLLSSIKVRVLAKRITSEQASFVLAGDREFVRIYSPPFAKEEVLGEILSVVSNKKSMFLVLDNEGGKGEYYEVPFFRDLELIMSLKVEIRNKEMFYKDTPLKIAEKIIFRTTRYNLNCSVLEIINEKNKNQ